MLCECGYMGILIRCGLFWKIRINWVYYGYISGESVCGIKYIKSCFVLNVYYKLRMWCEGKCFCLVKFWNMLFWVLCGGNRRYLKLYYFCMYL